VERLGDGHPLARQAAVPAKVSAAR
jgi:hypothetical protein